MAGIAAGAFAMMIITTPISRVLGDSDFAESLHYKSKFVFPEEYTGKIDEMLTQNVSHVKFGPTQARTGYPECGFHYFYFRPYETRRMRDSLCYLTFQRKKETVNGRQVIYYIAWVAPFCGPAYNVAVNKIFKIEEDTVQVISIDTSDHMPSLRCVTKICRVVRPNQHAALQHVFQQYTQQHDYNVKAIICGSRGIGKSYTAMLLKRHIEAMNNSVNVRLYDDVDPTIVGLNIKTLVLSTATVNTPVVILMDELDVILQSVIMDPPSFDPRLQHTKNKKTFNDMMDAISHTKYVICLYTTERTAEELYGIEEYRSLIRPGRIDLVLAMDENDCTLRNNFYENNAIQYPVLPAIAAAND